MKFKTSLIGAGDQMPTVEPGTCKILKIDPEHLGNTVIRPGANARYPMSTGWNFDEVPWVLDSCQLTAERPSRTAGNCQRDNVIIVPAVG